MSKFQIKSRVINPEKEETKTELPNNYKIILDKYDGREISSVTGCIAKDLYCIKINQLTGAIETPILYINDKILS